ncbi:MAG: hypothetical protein J5490_05110 [Bacteroidales bacterium]|nr:hypothetical protein [Bacteroidales bacterium]
MEEEFRIDITPQLEDFAHQLERDNRVVFSAGFGDGKTFFLDEFKKKYSKDYFFFTVYPVNYVISENEHIIEYIKRDILIQLADDQGLYYDKIKPKEVLKAIANSFSIKDIASFALGFPFLSKLSSSLASVEVSSLGSVAEQLSESHYSTNKYRDSFNYRGSIYESDAYTSFIARSLENLRKLDGRKTVLIIEDLDRIEPGKIFNILNVFAAHVDRHFVSKTSDKTENKFGFDKIITVMDNVKVEKCFNHLYGEDQNYQGYISKFMESRPFEYSIKQLAVHSVSRKLYDQLLLKEDYPQVLDVINALLIDRSIRDLERIYNYNPIDQIRSDADRQIGNYRISKQSPLFKYEAYDIVFKIDLLGALLTGSNRVTNDYVYYQLTATYASLAHNKTVNLALSHDLYRFYEEYDNQGFLYTSVEKTYTVNPPYGKEYSLKSSEVERVRNQIREMCFQ